MKKILLFIITFFLASLGSIHPQEKVWSLEECIKYAIDNNIQIKQQVLQTRFQENSLEQSKFNLLPTLNGQASHNYSFGRTLDETTYQLLIIRMYSQTVSMPEEALTCSMAFRIIIQSGRTNISSLQASWTCRVSRIIFRSILLLLISRYCLTMSWLQPQIISFR